MSYVFNFIPTLRPSLFVSCLDVLKKIIFDLGLRKGFVAALMKKNELCNLFLFILFYNDLQDPAVLVLFTVDVMNA